MKEEILTIPFVAHESSMNRMERTNKRLIVLNIVELVIILAMFLGIMLYFYMPTEVVDTSEQNVSEITDSEVSQSIGE